MRSKGKAMRKRGYLLSPADQLRLYETRVCAGLTIENLAKNANISRSWIARAEKLSGIRVSEYHLIKVVRELGCTVGFILGKEPYKYINPNTDHKTPVEQAYSESTSRLNGDIIVSAWDRATSRYITISEYEMPILKGTHVSICAALNRPAFIGRANFVL
jgi:transcriptional regulator with XRE-family HTH domain